MSNLPAIAMSFDDMYRLAESVARSRLFGMQSADQALTLMSIAQAEGRHPALAARDYDIIQGRPTKKSEAMQRDFLAAGGKIVWHELSDTEAKATFSHPQGGEITIGWDMDRATKAGLGGKDMWKKFPRQMLKARLVSEGVRTVFPTATSGMYVPEEAGDIEPIDVTPSREIEHQIEQWRSDREGKPKEPEFENVGDDLDRLIAQGNAVCVDQKMLKSWWQTHLTPAQRGILGAKGKGVGPYLPGWKSGEKQQAQPPVPEAEPPAVEPDTGGIPLPQEEPSGAQASFEQDFGLEPDPWADFKRNILEQVRAATHLDQIIALDQKFAAEFEQYRAANPAGWQALRNAIVEWKKNLAA